jgi:hypothetical protein
MRSSWNQLQRHYLLLSVSDMNCLILSGKFKYLTAGCSDTLYSACDSNKSQLSTGSLEEIAHNTTCWCCFCTEHSLGYFLQEIPDFIVNY